MNKKLCVIGFVLSAVLILIASVLIFQNAEHLKLNEWGDFVAGFASTIALLWVVLGFIQQGIGLKMNTESLKDQQTEITKQIEALEMLTNHIKRLADKR